MTKFFFTMNQRDVEISSCRKMALHKHEQWPWDNEDIFAVRWHVLLTFHHASVLLRYAIFVSDVKSAYVTTFNTYLTKHYFITKIQTCFLFLLELHAGLSSWIKSPYVNENIISLTHKLIHSKSSNIFNFIWVFYNSSSDRFL